MFVTEYVGKSISDAQAAITDKFWSVGDPLVSSSGS